MTNVMYGVAAGFAIAFGFPLVIYCMSLFLGLLFGPGVYFWSSLFLITIGLGIGSLVTETRNIAIRRRSNG